MKKKPFVAKPRDQEDVTPDPSIITRGSPEHVKLANDHPEYHDPRPDLESDHDLWDVLFFNAYFITPHEVIDVLRGMRSCGLRIATKEGGVLKLSPGTTYESVDSWEKDRENHLVPFAKPLNALMSEVERLMKNNPGKNPYKEEDDNASQSTTDVD